METVIRTAALKDAEAIFVLIQANSDLLVPRSLADIVKNIDRFIVAERETVIGCASYTIHPELGNAEDAIVEVQSLAVLSAYRRQGIGGRLVEAIAKRTEAFKPKQLLTLTFAPEFFASLGFKEIPKTQVMHKLYTGCINCTKHKDPFTCPEKAMAR